MDFKKKSWPGTIREVGIGSTADDGGTRCEKILVGGGNTLPFHSFEGAHPHPPVVALEVTDVEPANWIDMVREPFADVLTDPVAWAKKAVDAYGARMICLNLMGTDPDKENKSPAEAAELVKDVLAAVSVPLIIKGHGPSDKQDEVLSKCAETASGENCLIASAFEDHYKTLVAACIAYGHTLVAETPIDVNLAKQLNILLTDMNFPPEKIIIDPLTGGLGYGLEYTYSVMERIRLQALGGDPMMQMPFICFIGPESWKVKEVKEAEDKEMALFWEITTAISLLTAGAEILVLRHPEAAKQVRQAIEEWHAGS
jgi:acetyl-CoA decarbonylase/synthase complex subunit delta